MKLIWRFLVVCCFALLIPAAFAQTFDNSSLNGRYGFHSNATSIDNGGKASYPFAISGYYQFDGAGNMTGADTVSTSTSGGPIIVHRTYTGTYSVNADGTGTLHLNINPSFQPEGDFTIVLGGNQIEIVFAVPGNMNAFSLFKQ